MRGLVIVAHPDDETLWSGGLLLRRVDWQWTVLSLCRADDADRAPKFREACGRLGAEGLMSDLDDSPRLAALDLPGDIARRIVTVAPPGPWDLCLTHGANGEYGHRRHREVHRVVLPLAANGEIQCRELWTFACDCRMPEGVCRAAPWADERVELSADELAEKRRIIAEVYGFAAESFEARACVSPEGFTRVMPAASRGASKT